MVANTRICPPILLRLILLIMPQLGLTYVKLLMNYASIVGVPLLRKLARRKHLIMMRGRDYIESFPRIYTPILNMQPNWPHKRVHMLNVTGDDIWGQRRIGNTAVSHGQQQDFSPKVRK